MKKIISLFFCIALLTLVLVSCGEEEHVHQYNRKDWKSDATNHWYAATCECADAGVKNLAAHVDTMNDGFCDICNYLMCSNTEYSTTLKKGEGSHWYEPLCGHTGQNAHLPIKDVTPHKYNADGSCTDCGYQCNKSEYKDSWTSDADNHWHDPVCGHAFHPVSGLASHVDVAIDDKGLTDGKCDVCGYVMCAVPVKADGEGDDEFNARLAAFYKSEISYNELQHWYDPVCGHNHDVKDLAGHVDSEVDPDGVCDICLQPMPVQDSE